MKKILLSGLSLLLANSLHAGVTAKADSWQMMGLGMDANLTKLQDLTDEELQILWYWEGDTQAWKAFSKSPSLSQKIKEVGYWGDYIKRGTGFWVKARKDFSLTQHVLPVETLPTTKGWHQVSFSDGFYSINDMLTSGEGYSSIFAYRDSSWKYAVREDDGNITGDLNNISRNEGAWISLDNNSTMVHTVEEPYLYTNNTDTFTNKTFTINSSDTITFDQNGNVISSISNIDGGIWTDSKNHDWNKVVNIYKGDKQYKYYFSFNEDTSNLELIKIKDRNIKIYDNGVKHVIDENQTTFIANNTTVINDYNKTKTTNSTVKGAMDELKDMFENGTDLADTKISTIKSNLESVNDNDAKVTLALINLIEVLDEDIIKNNFILDDNSSLTLESFVQKVVPSVDDIINLSQDVASENITTLLQSLSNRLQNSADEIERVTVDNNYYFDYDGVKLTFADIKVIQTVMYGLAYKLQFLASYELGSSEWLKENTETIDGVEYEYINASYDPVGFLNSGTFMINPDATKLATAKSLLISFLEGYYNILNNTDFNQRGIEFPKTDLYERNLKRHIELALKNLKGENEFVKIIADWMEWNDFNMTDEYKSEYFKLDLNSLFNTGTALTINDFGTFEYTGGVSLNETNSKIANEPKNEYFYTLDIEVKDDDYTSTNNINNVFLLFKDENGTKYEGIDLLNEIFGIGTVSN
jgi:gas vesicle protein